MVDKVGNITDNPTGRQVESFLYTLNKPRD